MIIDNSNYYTEQHRNQFHFSPEANWMNDPNGMYYNKGEYHLFYQYYPDSSVWGPMHWGHAVSEDMVHWEHLPIALFPDSLGYIFSGSAVVDHNNTSGFGTKDNPPVIAIFTHHNMDGERADINTYQYQSIAFSLDNGRTFKKYEGNPVVPNPGLNDFRDPKVIWDEQNEQWVMVISAYDSVLFYISSNLRDWKRSGEFGILGDTRLWECPDLFPLKVEGTEEIKWILITSIQQEAPNGGTATGYFVGDWDGKSFSGDPNKQKWLDYGTDNYAFVTWSDVPKSDGRRLGIGWMSNWQYASIVPSEKWRSALTLPRELTLHKFEEAFEVFSSPVKELGILESERKILNKKSITENFTIASDGSKSLYKLDLSFENPGAGKLELKFSNSHNEFITIGYNGLTKEYFIDRTNAGKASFSNVFSERHTGSAKYEKKIIEMTIFLDHASLELFADKGRCVMTDIFFSTEPFTQIEILNTSTETNLINGSITTLSNTWR